MGQPEAENLEPHKKPRIASPDDVQDLEINELREELRRTNARVDEFVEKLQKHNERHYLLMGIIATLSFLAGMGIKILGGGN